MRNNEVGWEHECWNLMVSQNFEQGLKLRDLHFTESFFKYKSLSENTLTSISEGFIWMADINTLNDPFECSVQFDNLSSLKKLFSSPTFRENFNKRTGSTLNDGEIDAIITDESPYKTFGDICKRKGASVSLAPEEQLSAIQNSWQQIIDETNLNIRICSFSTVKDSLLLWAHYADQHKGISIEYDFIDNEEIRPFLLPIVYTNDVYKLEVLEDLNTLTKIGSTLLKAQDWSYEKEWRVTIAKKPNYFPQRIKTEKPRAIYLGTRFQNNKAELLSEFWRITKELNIPVYQMGKHPTQYKLLPKAEVTH
ncbi:DUF2971 domain-containing protein [Flaviaesturariibacter terrae]